MKLTYCSHIPIYWIWGVVLLALNFHLTDANIQVRLVGGSADYEGRVEVRQGSSGSWGTVCDDEWDITDANVVCSMLGYRYATRAVTTAGFGQGSGRIWIDELQYSVTSQNLDDCSFARWGSHDCKHAEDAGVVCDDSDIEVRLRNGTYRSGRVEVRAGTQPWGTVCDHGWDTQDAFVVCKMLGFGSSVGSVFGADYGPGSGPIYLNDVRCRGTENAIDECSAVKWGYGVGCSHEDDAGVICEAPSELDARLVDGDYRSGKLEVSQGDTGVWGSICNIGWDINDANVACRMLGFRSVREGTTTTSARSSPHRSEHIWLYGVGCKGTEDSLSDCPVPNGWGRADQCTHDEDVVLFCTADELEVRIVGGTYSSGLVEVRQGSSGEWGSICRTGWSMKEADVVCRMMGFPSVEIAVKAADKGFTVSSRDMPIWLENVSCRGDEDNIGNCRSKSWGSHTCSHEMDAGVLCLEIRLVGKSKTSRSGRVEVRRAGTGEPWGTVCDDNWDLNAAHVACRMLGYDYASNAVVEGGFGLGTEEIYLDNVVCDGDESSIDSGCSYRWKMHDCGHSEDAGVICAGKICVSPPDVPNSTKKISGQEIRDSVVYTCHPGFEMVGNATIYCMMDETWSKPPTCIVITCDSPPKVENSLILANHSIWHVGDVLTYHCETGFEISGTLTTSECLESKIWSIPPTCISITCSPPAMVENAIELADRSSWLVGDIITYHCKAGFQISGTLSSSECLDTKQWSVSPTCQKISCGPPQPIHKGYIEKISGVSYNDSAVYECNAGYTMISDSRSYCTENGDWSPIPLCHAITCQPPPWVDNAVELAERSSWLVGDIITYHCKAGFEIYGTLATSECLENRLWSVSPKCQKISCGPPRPIHNGYIEKISGVSYNDSAVYECSAGYTMMTDSNSYCAENGDWTPIPECHALSCGVPPIVEHARISELQGLSLGDLVRYQCIRGYVLQEHDFVLCLPDGKWSSNPICKGLSCGPPPNILNAYVSQPNATYTGDTFIHKCNPGYERIGEPTECLLTQEWSTSPRCQIIKCGQPPVVPYSDWINDSDSYGSRTWYHCHNGYECLDCQPVYCLASGTWEEPPVCHRISCGPPPHLTNSNYTVNGTEFGDELFYECEDGYILVGNHTSVCQADGTWTSSPKCQDITCGPPPKVEWSAVTVTGFGYYDKAVYTCNEGYQLSGDDTSYCLGSGNWSIEASCTIVSCDSPPSVSNASVNTTDGIYGDLAVYKCETGYKLIGDHIIKCLSSGNWSTPPTCNEITCGEPPIKQFANIDWSGDHYLSTATYQCSSGYGLVGNSTTFCQTSGKWTKSPVCEALTCGKPPTVFNTYSITMYPQWRVGEGITYRCLPGYKMSGRSISHCMEDQQWSQPPTCTSLESPNLPHPSINDSTTQSDEMMHTSAEESATSTTTPDSMAGASTPKRMAGAATSTSSTKRNNMIVIPPDGKPNQNGVTKENNVTDTLATYAAASSSFKTTSTTSTSKPNSMTSTTLDSAIIPTWSERKNNTVLIVQKQPGNITFEYISDDSTAEGEAVINTNLTEYGDNSSFTNFSSINQTHDRSEHAVKGNADNSSVTSDSKGEGYNRSSVVIGCSALAGIAVVIAGAAVAYWIYTKKRRSMAEESNFVHVDNQMYNGTELKSITVYSFKQPREDGSEDI